MEEKTTITEPFSVMGEVDSSIDPAFLGLVAAIEPHQLKYLVYSVPNKQVLYAAEYHFPFIKTIDDALPALRKVFDKDLHLLKPYHRYHFLVYSSPSLIPAGTPEWQRNGIIKTTYNEELQFDEDPDFEFGALYTINKFLKQTIHSQHPRAIAMNAVFRFIRMMKTNAPDNSIGILMGNGYFDAVCWQNNRCKSYSRYTFGTAEDFLYFLTLFAASVGVERSEAKVFFAGELDINSAIYSICYPYFRELLFMDPQREVRFSPGLEFLSKSRVIPLLTLIP